jgi:hypothetical protein
MRGGPSPVLCVCVCDEMHIPYRLSRVLNSSGIYRHYISQVVLLLLTNDAAVTNNKIYYYYRYVVVDLYYYPAPAHHQRTSALTVRYTRGV